MCAITILGLLKWKRLPLDNDCICRRVYSYKRVWKKYSEIVLKLRIHFLKGIWNKQENSSMMLVCSLQDPFSGIQPESFQIFQIAFFLEIDEKLPGKCHSLLEPQVFQMSIFQPAKVLLPKKYTVFCWKVGNPANSLEIFF